MVCHDNVPPAATPSKSSSRRLRNKAGSGGSVSYDNRLHPSDSEPEKEVMEEKDSELYSPTVTVRMFDFLLCIASGLSGSRRGLRPSDHLTGQQVPTTPTMTSSTHSRQPASGRRGQQPRSAQVSSLQTLCDICCLQSIYKTSCTYALVM